VPGGESGLAPATPVTAQLTADGDGIWQLLDAGVDPPPRVLLARLTGPGALGSVRSYDLPEGQAAWWFTLSPDDTFVAIHLRTPDGAPWSFVFAPVGADASTVEAGPAIEGTLAGLVPVVTADTWAGS
jgi:hypothetical protein